MTTHLHGGGRPVPSAVGLEQGAIPAAAAVRPRSAAGRADALAAGAACLVAIAIYGSFGRPLWIDEFLHFALGSHRTLAEAWDTISATTVAVNHGQTGVYMLLDWGLLRLFGADPVALRLPSLLSAGLLLGSAAIVLRVRGFGVGWQLLALAALLGQTTLMYFVGEARPYMPLAAAAMGTLAYYLARGEERPAAGVRVLGAVSIGLGVTMHPYFSVYWGALFAFAHLLAVAERRVRVGWRPLLAHVDLALSVPAAALYFALGAATWMRSGPAFAYDPYEWIRADGLYRTFVEISHVQFAGGLATRLLVAVLATPVLAALAPVRLRARLGPLVAPALLLALALALSLFLAWVSHRRSYWVLPRQWVASMALVPVAAAWWWAEVARAAAAGLRPVAAAALAAGLLAVWEGSATPVLRIAETAAVSARARVEPVPEAGEPREAPTENDGWVALANRNVRAGGPVWEVFRRYYGK